MTTARLRLARATPALLALAVALAFAAACGGGSGMGGGGHMDQGGMNDASLRLKPEEVAQAGGSWRYAGEAPGTAPAGFAACDLRIYPDGRWQQRMTPSANGTGTMMGSSENEAGLEVETSAFRCAPSGQSMQVQMQARNRVTGAAYGGGHMFVRSGNAAELGSYDLDMPAHCRAGANPARAVHMGMH